MIDQHLLADPSKAGANETRGRQAIYATQYNTLDSNTQTNGKRNLRVCIVLAIVAQTN